jgi:hypothetical protein
MRGFNRYRALKVFHVGSGWYRPNINHRLFPELSLMAGFYKREQSY